MEEGRLKFYAHVGGSYREPGASLSVGEWVHAVGVVDGKTVKLYINGSLVDTVEAECGGIKYPESVSAQKFVIGADVNNDGSGENFSNADICLARIYGRALTDAEIKLLGEKAFDGASVTPKKPGINCGIITSDTAVSGGILHVSPHLNRVRKDEVSRVTCTLSYDPAKMTYLGTANLKSDASITKASDGNLEIACENFSGDDFFPGTDHNSFGKGRTGLKRRRRNRRRRRPRHPPENKRRRNYEKTDKHLRHAVI